MNGGAPTCPRCGGLSTNPSESACRFCGSPLAQAAPPMMGYGQPPYAQPQPYGQPPYAQPPHAPPPYAQPQPYGQPPYAQPPHAPPPYAQPPYGQPGVTGFGGAPVQQFGGNYGRNVNQGWGGGWSSYFVFRLVIIGIALSLSLVGACISALSH